MQEKYIFRELLTEIKELADTKGNVLTSEEVKDFFANAHLTDEQMTMVYDYLNSQKIKVEGYEGKTAQAAEQSEEVSEDEEVVAPEAEELARMYHEELESIEKLTPEEEFRMFMQAANGDQMASSRLIEQYLDIVYDLSMTYVGGNLSQSDLIQEGNVGLLMAMSELKSMGKLEDYQNYLFQAISEAMEEATSEASDVKDMDEEIASKVNHLNEAVQNLEQDLGHKVSVEELSVYLEMPKEEIEDILRMAGDKMKE